VTVFFIVWSAVDFGLSVAALAVGIRSLRKSAA
jgi:hypothetical protein